MVRRSGRQISDRADKQTLWLSVRHYGLIKDQKPPRRRVTPERNVLDRHRRPDDEGPEPRVGLVPGRTGYAIGEAEAVTPFTNVTTFNAYFEMTVKEIIPYEVGQQINRTKLNALTTTKNEARIPQTRDPRARAAGGLKLARAPRRPSTAL